MKLDDRWSSAQRGGLRSRSFRGVPTYWHSMVVALVAVFALSTARAARAARAQTSEIVRGTVTDTAHRPIAGASVVVSAIGTTVERTATTDNNGHFVTLFASEYRNYTVVVRKIGFAVELRSANRSGLSNVISTTMVLRASAVTLAPLTVTAPRLLPRDHVERPSIGGEATSTMNSRDFLHDPSKVDSMTALVPGLHVTDGGISALGAPTDQNGVVLDGLPLAGIDLPPDAICGASVATTTSDPARGGFAGAQTALSSCRGNDYFTSTFRGTLNDPTLSWTDRASLIAPPRIAAISGFVSGPLRFGGGHYHWSLYANDLVQPSPSLLTLNQSQLAAFAFASDTVAALRSALTRIGVPLSSGISQASSRSLSSELTADWNLGASTTLLLSANASFRSNSGLGIGALSLPSVAMNSSGRSGRIMLQGTHAIGGLLDDLSLVWTSLHAQTDPALTIPGASVLVTAGAGSGGLQQIEFGGARFRSSSTTSIWNVKNEASWFAGDGAHQLRFGQELDVESDVIQALNDSVGTYQYQSISDVASNLPISYTRLASTPAVRPHSISASMWFADIVRVSHHLSLEGGLRGEAATLGPHPLHSSVLDSTFAVRTDRVPAYLSLSPRLGFALLLRQEPVHHVVVRQLGTLDTLPIIYLDEDQFSPRATRGNTGAGTTLYGNLGAYRGNVPTRLLTALSSGEEKDARPGLTCVGAATPMPDWSVATSPASCADGSESSPFGASLQQAAALGPGYRPPTDWKLNLGLTGINWWNTWSAFGKVIFKHGQNYSSWIDRNLQTTPSFELANEGGRPVYGNPQLITQAGQFAPAAARILPQFGAVREYESDLTSDALQFNASIWTGSILASRLRFILQYYLNLQRRQFRGFDGTTSGDPFGVQSSAGVQPMHEFALTTPIGRIGPIDANIRFDLQSGTAYTPVVVGDINGDGLGNDRAFIFDPNGRGTSAVRSQMQSLLADAPTSAQQCLASQLNRIAGANSCRGPWHFRFDVALKYEPQNGVGPGGGLRVSAQVFNLGAVLARALGAADAQSGLPPDNRLLFLTGFDPGTSEFRYQVNPAFGRPLNAGTGDHQYLPVEFQVGLEYRFGGPTPDPLLRSLGLKPSKKTAYTPEQVANALNRLLSNPVSNMLQFEDSLQLSTAQAGSIREIAAGLQRQADSLVAPLAAFVLRRGSHLTDTDFEHEEGAVLRELNPMRNRALQLATAMLNHAQQIKWLVLSERLKRRTK